MQTVDHGYALTGTTYFANDADAWLVRTDSDGNALWSQTYGGANTDFAYSIVQISDGGFAIAGQTILLVQGTMIFGLFGLVRQGLPSGAKLMEVQAMIGLIL